VSVCVFVGESVWPWIIMECIFSAANGLMLERDRLRDRSTEGEEER